MILGNRSSRVPAVQYLATDTTIRRLVAGYPETRKKNWRDCICTHFFETTHPTNGISLVKTDTAMNKEATEAEVREGCLALIRAPMLELIPSL